ncbi:tectonic-like complex member Mks1 [Drosophila albomicans]|uniref:Tectonic-like complex member Mks1 n=1 Tax=Drosophila albomicans TaxID=7291 RepID=A0A6P8XZI4_DROAB|nr:tectonic-like complex member Mks1 [Drosophila albomicans]
MFRSSAPKRTGIYRVCGDMSDFQMELRLRHISEWLPVPKFEYTGANANSGPHVDHYPESPMSSTFGDFFIYVPHDDHNGNYCNYYDYYNPSSEYRKSSSRSYTSRDSYASRSSSSNALMGSTGTGNASALTGSTETRSVPSSELETHFEQQSAINEDDFHAQNRELCNGATANLCISWQQKHFSRAELQRYSDASKCVTTLQRRYHRWTKQTIELQLRYNEQLAYHQQAHAEQLKARSRRRRRSSSKRNSEAEVEATKEVEGEVDSPLLPDDPNFAARTCLIHTLIDADLQEEEREKQLQGYQLMRIYAQLQRDTLLFSLRYSPTEGLLYVYPDFNLSADDMEYSLELDNDCRQLFAYGLENVTLPLLQKTLTLTPPPPLPVHLPPPLELHSPPATATASELLTHYEQERQLAAERRRLLQFAVPPKRMRRVSLLLQLHEAQHFEHPNIHVRYYVNPPKHTLLELEPGLSDEPFPLRGATATCLEGGAGNLASFSHCWQLTLLCEETFVGAEEEQQLLHIYFEVISIDGWQRERCEGYAHFACSLLAPLPVAATHGIRLQCIRPVGSWLDALNRYFIGGRKLFDFVGYFSSHSQSQLGPQTLHSRFEADQACAMRSTGNILFSVRKIQQRQLPLGYQLDGEDSSDVDDFDTGRRSKEGVSSTLDEVLAAYVEARDRIEALLGHAAS